MAAGCSSAGCPWPFGPWSIAPCPLAWPFIGTLSVTISISRFFKIHARADVHYKLRGGRSETTVNTNVSADIEDKRLQQAADKLKKARG